jgi:hypothetical protein
VSLKTSKEAAEIAINSQLVDQRGQQNTFLALAVATEMEMYKLSRLLRMMMFLRRRL